MLIRLATLEDAGAISQLACTLSQKFVQDETVPGAAQRLLSTMSPAGIEKNIKSGYRYHVAELNGAVVGVIGIKDNRFLFHLFVAEHVHRRGIARQLWQIALQACMDEGNHESISVNSSFYACPAYEKLGFVALAEQQERNGVLSIPMIYNM